MEILDIALIQFTLQFLVMYHIYVYNMFVVVPIDNVIRMQLYTYAMIEIIVAVAIEVHNIELILFVHMPSPAGMNYYFF